MTGLLTPYWTKLNYHPIQQQLWNCKKRFVAAVAGRGSGKTELARRRIVTHLAYKKLWPNPIYVYALPTYPQAKKVAWDPIIQLIPPNWIAKNGINKTESCISTIFGSKLYIVGMDKPHRIEGVQIDGIVIDESSDQKPGTYTKTILPMLTHRNAWAWRIGVPKKSGVGRAEFKDFFEKGMSPDSNIASFHWKSSDILTPEQIETFRDQIGDLEFEEQFEAKWLELGGGIYYNFSERNLDSQVSYISHEPIVVCCDFNVSPMCWLLGHLINNEDTGLNEFHAFDEIFIRDTNTEATLDRLYALYGDHLAGWLFIGDASARSRKTSASRSDYLIIKNDVRFQDKKIFFPSKNTAVKDRYATVNRALKSASGNIRLKIHPKCKKLIDDFNKMNYEEGTSDPEDYSGTDISHMSDALGYALCKIMPIRVDLVAVPEIIIM